MPPSPPKDRFFLFLSLAKIIYKRIVSFPKTLPKIEHPFVHFTSRYKINRKRKEKRALEKEIRWRIREIGFWNFDI